MKKIAPILLLISVCLFFANCSNSRHSTEKKLYGKKWILTAINGKQITQTEGKIAQLSFTAADSKVVGNTGCNNLSGTFTLNGDRGISLGKMATTRMACAGDNIENIFLAVVEKANMYTVQGSQLMLYENENLLAVFTAE